MSELHASSLGAVSAGLPSPLSVQTYLTKHFALACCIAVHRSPNYENE